MCRGLENAHPKEKDCDSDGKKIAVIDAIKGISTVGIVIYHYSHFGDIVYPFKNILGIVYEYGYYLVDLFFIISGFLFCMNFAEKIKDGKLDIREFMLHRYMKLFPLFLLSTAVTAIGQWILYYHTGNTFMHGADLYSLFLNLIGLQHVGLTYELTFNGPAWYISVLMLCYAVYFYISKYNCHAGVTWLVCLTLFRCNLSVPMINQSIFRGLLEFTVGRVCYEIWRGGGQKQNRKISGFILAFTAVMWLAFRHRQLDILGDKFLFFIIVFWPALFLFCLSSKIAGNMLCNKPCLWLGKISYSLYLWHFPVEVGLILTGYARRKPLDFTCTSVWVLRMLLSFAAAIGSFYFVEPYLRKQTKEKWMPWMQEVICTKNKIM